MKVTVRLSLPSLSESTCCSRRLGPHAALVGWTPPCLTTARPARFRCPYGASTADRHAAYRMPVADPVGISSRLGLDARQYPPCLSATRPGEGSTLHCGTGPGGPFFAWAKNALRLLPPRIGPVGGTLFAGLTLSRRPAVVRRPLIVWQRQSNFVNLWAGLTKATPATTGERLGACSKERSFA